MDPKTCAFSAYLLLCGLLRGRGKGSRNINVDVLGFLGLGGCDLGADDLLLEGSGFAALLPLIPGADRRTLEFLVVGTVVGLRRGVADLK